MAAIPRTPVHCLLLSINFKKSTKKHVSPISATTSLVRHWVSYIFVLAALKRHIVRQTRFLACRHRSGLGPRSLALQHQRPPGIFTPQPHCPVPAQCREPTHSSLPHPAVSPRGCSRSEVSLTSQVPRPPPPPPKAHPTTPWRYTRDLVHHQAEIPQPWYFSATGSGGTLTFPHSSPSHREGSLESR